MARTHQAARVATGGSAPRVALAQREARKSAPRVALAQREARKSAPTEGGVKGQKAGAGAGGTYARLQETARGEEKDKEKEEAETRKRLLLAQSRANMKAWYRKIGMEWSSSEGEGEAEGEAAEEGGSASAAVGGKRAAMGASDGRKAGARKRKAGRRLVVAAAESSSSSSSSSESSSESSGDEAGKKSGKAEEAKADDNDIAVGHTVHIEGLVVALDMNGRTGVVTGRYHDRWVVRVDGKDCNFAAKNLRLERVEVSD